MADISQGQSQMAAGAMQRPMLTQGCTMAIQHDSSCSSSSSSGRERRRMGKLKQTRKLDAARGRIHELEAQVSMLHGVIAELTSRTQCEPLTSPSAQIFNLYTSEVCDAGSQTDISVEHWQPDVFVTVSSESSSPVLGTAFDARTSVPDGAKGADAAAGDFNSQHLACLPEVDSQRLANTGAPSAVMRCGPLPSVHTESACAEPQFGEGLDFDSQYLVHKNLLAADGRCGTLKDFNSQNLACTSGLATLDNSRPQPIGSMKDSNFFGFSPAGTVDLPAHASPRAFDASSGDVQLDFNSQNLADQPQSGPRATVHENLLAADGRCETLKDFNSQNLAFTSGPSTSEDSRPLPIGSMKVPNSLGVQECGPMPLDASPRAFDGIAHSDSDSQHLALESGDAVGSWDPDADFSGNEAPGSSNPGTQASPAFFFNANSKKSSGGCDDNSDQSQCGRVATVHFSEQPQCGPSATVHNILLAADGRDGTLKDINSQNLAYTSGLTLVENSRQLPIGSMQDSNSPPVGVQECGPMPLHASPRAFDAIAQSDSNSQHLALKCEDAVGQVEKIKGLNSHNLATTSVHPAAGSFRLSPSSSCGVKECGPLPLHASPRAFDAIAHSDFSSQHLARVSTDAVGQVENMKDFNSQTLATDNDTSVPGEFEQCLQYLLKLEKVHAFLQAQSSESVDAAESLADLVASSSEHVKETKLRLESLRAAARS